MNRFAAMTLIALFTTFGCSNTTRTPVESALDQAADPATGEGYYSEPVEPEAALQSVEPISDEPTLERDEAVVAGAEGALAGASDELLGSSWSLEENERVYLAVKELGGFGDAAVVPLAHFRLGSRHVVIAWPALSGAGELTGAQVYGVCVEEQEDSSFESCADRWTVNEVTAAHDALESALGGADYEVVNGQVAASIDELGQRLTEVGNAFVAAAPTGDREDLFRGAQEFLQLLPVEDVAFDSSLAQLLYTAARDQKEFRHMKTEQGDLFAAMTIKVRGDWQDVTTMSLTAQQVATGSDRWRIVDYW